MDMTGMPCPCGSNECFDICCGPIIRGTRDAATALELMRSRYSAFTLADADYLNSSHHPKTRQPGEKASVRRWARSVRWVGLTVIDTTGGTSDDDSGFVTFKAVYIENGIPGVIHEKSYFERAAGRWFYVSGVHLD